MPTLSLVDGSANYDGNVHTDTATAVDPIDGVTPVAGSFLITYNGSTTAPTQAGSYAVVATFASSDLNYADASITGTLTISQATPTISIASSYPNFIYDTFAQAQYVSEVGVDGVTPVNGTLSVLYNGSSTLPVNAGTYDVSVTFTSNDPNYLSTTADGSMTIQQSGVSLYYSLNGGAYYYFYNGMPQGVIGTATGYFNDPVNGTFTYTYFDSTGAQLPGTPTNAGDYTFTEYFTSLDPNYASGSFSYSFAIYAATPTVTVTGGTFAYNGQGQAATATAVGIDGVTPVPGTASFTYNGSSSTPVLPGTYAVVATFTPTDPNYSSSTGSGTLVINKATPAFSNLSSPKVNVGTSTVTLSGHIGAGSASPGGDDVAITLNGVTMPVTVSGGGNFSRQLQYPGPGDRDLPDHLRVPGRCHALQCGRQRLRQRHADRATGPEHPDQSVQPNRGRPATASRSRPRPPAIPHRRCSGSSAPIAAPTGATSPGPPAPRTPSAPPRPARTATAIERCSPTASARRRRPARR